MKRNANLIILLSNLIAAILLSLIIIFIIVPIFVSAISNNQVITLLASLPFSILSIICLFCSIKEVIKIFTLLNNKRHLYLNKDVKIVTAKIIKSQSKLLSHDEDSPNLYCYSLICEWQNPNDGKKYYFKSGYLWNKHRAFLNSNVNVYVDDKIKKYYVDISKIEKNDQETI